MSKPKVTDGVFNLRTQPGDMLAIRKAAAILSKETGVKPNMTAALRASVKLYIHEKTDK